MPATPRPPVAIGVGGRAVDTATRGVGHGGTRSSVIAALTSSVVARFASVGIVNTVVDFGLFLGLVAAGVSAVPANGLSTTAGMAVSFAGNRRFVFGASGNRLKELALFVLVCGIGIWVIQPLVIVGVTSALTGATSLAEVLIAALAKVAGILVAAVWNFALYGRLVFRPPPGNKKGLSAT